MNNALQRAVKLHATPRARLVISLISLWKKNNPKSSSTYLASPLMPTPSDGIEETKRKGGGKCTAARGAPCSRDKGVKRAGSAARNPTAYIKHHASLTRERFRIKYFCLLPWGGAVFGSIPMWLTCNVSISSSLLNALTTRFSTTLRTRWSSRTWGCERATRRAREEPENSNGRTWKQQCGVLPFWEDQRNRKSKNNGMGWAARRETDTNSCRWRNSRRLTFTTTSTASHDRGR